MASGAIPETIRRTNRLKNSYSLIQKSLKIQTTTMFDQVKPVTLSRKASSEVQKIMQNKNIPPDYGLRVGVRGGGGCGGAKLIIGFDRKKDSDLAYELDGITVYVDKKHTMYVIGKEVDFYDGEDARGFVFVDRSER